MKLQTFNKRQIDFLGYTIGNGMIELQPHIVEKLLAFLDKLEHKKQLQAFLGTHNYAKLYIDPISQP